MRNETRPAGTRYPGRLQSEWPADFNRNRWPTSVRNARPISSESAGGRLRTPQQIVELGSAGGICGDHLAVENGLVAVEQGRQLVAELVKAPIGWPLRETKRPRPCWT